MMSKTELVCTGARSNLRDRVWGEVEKESVIALPGRGGAQRAPALEKLCIPSWEDLMSL